MQEQMEPNQLYEDEGTDYNYQKGGYSCIRLFWDDAHSILIIGKRSGQYEGMEPVRNLKIVKISLVLRWKIERNRKVCSL